MEILHPKRQKKHPPMTSKPVIAGATRKVAGKSDQGQQDGDIRRE
jgi:hypothetical protein